MKTIGLIGGTSWQATADYYKIINETVEKRLGRHCSAKMLISSINLIDVFDPVFRNDWKTVENILANSAKRLQDGGADFFLICANTMHKVADSITRAIDIPIIHIIDETAKEIKQQNIQKVALLGTSFTMEEQFYHERLNRFGINAIIPNPDDRKIVHDIIINELTLGIINDESRDKYISIIEKMKSNGADGVILGCTEIPLLIEEHHVTIPLFNTTAIHSLAAVERALEK